MRTKQIPLKSTQNYELLFEFYQHKLQCFYQNEMNPITNTIFFLPIQYFLYMQLGTKYSKKKLQQFLCSYFESKDRVEYLEEDIIEIMNKGLNENDFISFMYNILEQESPLVSTSKFSPTYTLQLYELIDTKGQGYITKKDFLQVNSFCYFLYIFPFLIFLLFT